MGLSHLAQDIIDLAETANTFGPDDEWTTRFRLCSAETCSTVSCWETQSCNTIPKTWTRWQNQRLRGQRFCWRSSLEKKNYGVGGSDWLFRAWQLWAMEKRSSTQWWKEVKLDYPWCQPACVWEFQWRLKYTVTARRQILWRINIDTLYFSAQERVPDGDLSIKKMPTAKNCADVGMKQVFASLPQQHCKFVELAVCWPWISHTTRCTRTRTSVDTSRRRRCRTDNSHYWLRTSRLVQKRNETIGTVEELSISHKKWIMTGEREEEKQAMCNE